MGDPIRIRLRTAAAALALAALAACSSTEDRITTLDALGVLRDELTKPDRPAPLSPQQIAQAITTVPGPLKFIEVTSRGGQGVFAPIETNRGYVTFASSAGQNVVFRDGFAVQSRGLGGDLMSSDEDALLPLLRSATRGTAPYAMRFLSGDNDTIAWAYTCNVLPGGETAVATAGGTVAAREVEVQCVGRDGPDFVSEFKVAGGEVLEGRQWFGPLSDDLVYRTLRR